MQKLKDHGRFVVAGIALAIAFVLSVQFSDRGVEFDPTITELNAEHECDGQRDACHHKAPVVLQFLHGQCLFVWGAFPVLLSLGPSMRRGKHSHRFVKNQNKGGWF